MPLIKGITVRLYQRTRSGVDELNAPIYTESAVDVENVLVSPVSVDDLIQDAKLYGKKAVYELHIPKGDTHNWENVTVEFFGQRWKTFGFVSEYIEELAPLDWNKKVKVERYG